MTISPNKLLPEIKEITLETGNYIRKKQADLQSVEIRYKGKNDLVSEVDVYAEEMLIRGFKKLLPGSVFLSEEKHSKGTTNTDKPLWIIDPLDGTTNFLHSFPAYSISIALYSKQKPVTGIVYDIKAEELFWTTADHEHAYMNDEHIRVTDVEQLDAGLFATGFPTKEFSKIGPYTDLMKDLMVSTHGLRRMGSAALDLAWVACGRFEGFYEYGLNPWDIAAGSYILRKAGGIVTDFGGNNNCLHAKEIIASNKNIYEPFFDKVTQYLKHEEL